jgi:UDP-N-acetylmuramate dehydrogenase
MSKSHIEIKKNFSLLSYNTFHLDVSTEYFAAINTLQDLKQLIADPLYPKVSKLVLGGGSNVLFTKNYKGLVILNNIKGVAVSEENEDEVYVRSGAGVIWNDLVMYCVKENYGGIENLSLIPGKAGAAPVQNIGAYGVELKDLFQELEGVELATGKLKKFSLADCRFGYRDSVFKNELKNLFMITSITLRLQKNPVFNTSYGAIETEMKAMNVEQVNVRAISDAVCNIRRSKLPDPVLIGNAGSFFKNPEVSIEVCNSLKEKFPELIAHKTQHNTMKLAAGWLIEQCGWKGKTSGHVGMHAKQALVLVNYGNATGQELLNHAKAVQESVIEKFNVLMEMEVNVI